MKSVSNFDFRIEVIWESVPEQRRYHDSFYKMF